MRSGHLADQWIGCTGEAVWSSFLIGLAADPPHALAAEFDPAGNE